MGGMNSKVRCNNVFFFPPQLFGFSFLGAEERGGEGRGGGLFHESERRNERLWNLTRRLFLFFYVKPGYFGTKRAFGLSGDDAFFCDTHTLFFTSLLSCVFRVFSCVVGFIWFSGFLYFFASFCVFDRGPETYQWRYHHHHRRFSRRLRQIFGLVF